MEEVEDADLAYAEFGADPDPAHCIGRGAMGDGSVRYHCPFWRISTGGCGGEMAGR
jgi:hypothetical protein